GQNAAQGGRGAAQEPGGTCTVEGLVVNSTTGRPLKKAIVIAQSAAGGRGATSQAPQRGALTSADGRFTLTLNPGTYWLRVTRNGYLDQGYGQMRPADSASTLTLAPGQHVTDLTFRLLPMGVVTGRISDEDGEPMRNVHVEALRRSYLNGRWQLIPATSASTNDLGAYRLIGLSPAKYYLCAVYNGFAGSVENQSYVPLCYRGSIGVSGATPVEVLPGREVSRLDFDLRPVHTVHVRGRVSAAETGEPVSGANVVFMRHETPWSGSQMRGMTDSAGHFDFRAVPPGRYLLVARWFSKNKLSSGREAIEIGNTDVQDVAVVLNPGFDISGTVRLEGDAELNLGSLRVNIQPLEPLEPATPGSRVGPTGVFVLKDIPAGSYSISVCCPGGDFYLKSATLGAKDVLNEGFTLSTTTSDSLDLLLTP